MGKDRRVTIKVGWLGAVAVGTSVSVAVGVSDGVGKSDRAIILSEIRFTVLEGIAKPKFVPPKSVPTPAELTPMTSPDRDIKGPPLLPGAIAASV